MHEATRIFCCRAGFVLLCLVPTTVVGAWIGIRHSSVYATARQKSWQTILSRTLGLVAQVGRVEEPRPGEFVLHDIRLVDPDAPTSRPPLAKVSQLQLAPRAQGLVILGGNAEIQSEHLPRLWAILHERLVRGPEVTSTPVLVSLSTLELAANDASDATKLSASDVRLQLASSSTKARAAIEFRLENHEGEPVRMAVERDRAAHPVATRWSIHTGDAPLPCSAFVPCLPELARLGPDCTFHGYLTSETRDTNWQAIVSGTFSELDLERLVGQPFHHTLTGRAQASLNQAHWRDGKLVAAAGSLKARQGVIGRSLWEAAADSLSLQLVERLRQTSNDEVRYGELAIGFQLSGQSLEVTGHCQTDGENIVLADQYGPLVHGASRVEPIALVRALVPDSELQVPAVSEARQLIYLLPLPDAPAIRRPR